MKIAYLGLDFLRSALDAALREGCEVLKIFTCPADNVTEFNLAVRETARREAIPLSMERLRARDLAQLRQAGCELLLCAGYYYRVPVTEGPGCGSDMFVCVVSMIAAVLLILHRRCVRRPCRPS